MIALPHGVGGEESLLNRSDLYHEIGHLLIVRRNGILSIPYPEMKIILAKKCQIMGGVGSN